jgi:iron(III) transport system substrate-binding protein
MYLKKLLGTVLALCFFVVAFSSSVYSADMRAAKKEGKVVWYSSITLSISQKICNTFNQKNLGIKCVLHRSGSSKLYKRYLKEARGGIFRADVFHTSNIGQFVILHNKRKFLRPYKVVGGDKFLSNFKTDDGKWYILRSSVMVPVYNTKLLKSSDVPDSWLGYLDSKWKNKLVISDPNYGGFSTITMIALENMFGGDYFQKLKANNPRRWGSAAGTLGLVSRGEVLMTHGAVAYGAFNKIKAGEPLAMAIPKEGVPFVRSPNAILAKAPHPNAAEVYADYLFSKEAQQILANRGLYVGHPGITYPKEQTPLSKFKLVEVPADEISKKSKPARKKFKKIWNNVKLEGKKKKKKKKKK